MDSAFNKETKRIVKAFAVYKDTSYITPEKDIWIVNPDEIENYQEILEKENIEYIECSYKKGHDRHYEDGNISAVRPHFFIPNREKRGINIIPESNDHKRIKAFMFNLFDNKLDVSFTYAQTKSKSEGIISHNIKLEDLDLDWDKFKMTTQEDFFETNIVDIYNTRRVDVLIPFKNKHELLGEGIAIEVQLSKQSKTNLDKRTIERALKGYSTIWIDKTHFKESLELDLIDNNLNLYAWQSILYNNSNKIAEKIYDKMQNYSREFDEKINNNIILLNNKIKEYKELSAAGHICPDCKKNNKIGYLSMKKDRSALYCTNISNSGKNKCYFMVKL